MRRRREMQRASAGRNNPDAGGADSGACVPLCAGKSCGDDGCGGACGVCAGGQTCTAAGQCVFQGTDTVAQPDVAANDAAAQTDGVAAPGDTAGLDTSGIDTAGVDTGLPIAQDTAGDVAPPGNFVPGRASSCGAGGPDHRGGLALLLCLLTLAWRRRGAASDRA